MSDLAVNDGSYQQLLDRIGECLALGRQRAFEQVNSVLVETYWQIGRYIVEFEQEGKERAKYGAQLLQVLSRDLKAAYGKGFSRSNLQYMRLFYLKYENYQTLSGKLSWSHYTELLAISDDLARSFYQQQCIQDRWSVRELKRQKDSALLAHCSFLAWSTKLAPIKPAPPVTNKVCIFFLIF